MRGISETLWIIVAAIVIMVTALVVLTIFSSGISNFTTITQAQAFCETQGRSSCGVTGQLPPSWQAQTVKVDGAVNSCFGVTGKSNCAGFPATPTG